MTQDLRHKACGNHTLKHASGAVSGLCAKRKRGMMLFVFQMRQNEKKKKKVVVLPILLVTPL
jgi:hypothetical protein